MKKRKKRHKILYYVTICIIIFIFIAISATLITFQSSFAKEKIKKAMISFAKDSGIDLKFDKLEGILPFEYYIKNVQITAQDTKIDIKELSFRIKFLPLFKKSVSFKSFSANNIDIESLTGSETDQNEKTSLVKVDEKTENDILSKKDFLISLPIKLNFDNIKLQNLHLKFKDTLATLDISGKAKLLKYAKALFLTLNVQRKDFAKSYLDISFKAYKKTKFFKSKANLKVADIKVLSPFYKYDRNISFDMTLDSLGTFKSFNNINDLFSKLDGKINGHIYKIDDIATILNQKASYSFDFSFLEDSSINISKGSLRNDFLEIYLDALLDKNLNIQKTNLTFRIDELTKINNNLFGSLISKITYENTKINSSFDLKDFSIYDISFADFKGSIDGQYSGDILSAKLSSSTFTLNEIFNMTSNLKYQNKILNISNLNITSPSLTLFANLDLTPSLNLIGNGNINFNDLAPLGVLYPKKLFNSSVQVNFEFNQKVEKKSFQNLSLDIRAQNYFFDTLYGDSARIYLSIDRPFSNPEMDIRTTFNTLKFHDLKIQEIAFSCTTKEENWPYELSLIASLKKPIEIESNGFFKILKDDFNLNIQEFKGNLFSNSFISPKPVLVSIQKDKFQLSDLDIEFAFSSIIADINFTKEISIAKVNLKNFPLDFLSINPLDLDVTGYVDLNFDIEKKFASTNGILDIEIKALEILALGDEKPLKVSGSLKSKVQNDYFNLDSSLKLKNTQIISINGKIPINLNLASLKVNINDQKDLSLSASYDGKVEELLDFINIGPQRIEGNLKTNLNFSNTLKDLKMTGFSSFENGYFENYYTGTILKDITARMNARDEKVTLEYLKGKDPENGKIEAEGVFSLSQKQDFPFFFKTQIDDLLCVDSNVIRSKATALIEISGNRISSTAKGNAKVNYLDMAIPDKLPIIIPDLKPTFISHPSKNHENNIEKPKIYPIHLNFDLDVTEPIKIHGQGLDSTWKGSFKIGGTYMNFETKGDLDLIKGSYVFSGKHFDLKKGKVSFTGKANEMPILDIQATINQRGVEIIADVEGPLDNPKITFSSSPPLPSSSIMALLIFGQQLNELTDSQTVILASTMGQNLEESPLSGLGSNSLVNQPSAPELSSQDKAAVQFGKYLTKGIVVSLSQGAEQGSSNIIIEVDLKNGFIFQAESQQQEEQGKFSLKWRRNY